MKVGVIGAGGVGSSAVLSTVLRGCAREIVVVDRVETRARGVVHDVRYGASLSPRVDVVNGTLDDLAGAQLVMITAGVNERSGGATDRSDGQGRLRLLEANVGVYAQILPELYRVAPDTVVLVLTDPPDPLADLVLRFGFRNVISSGTYLDSLRFRFQLATRLGVDPASVDANVLGEHGTTEVLVWSSARVEGAPFFDAPMAAGFNREELRREVEHDVRYANIAIIEGTGASQFGIGMVAARIAEIVLRDEGAVIPIGSYNPRYGCTLSMPSVLGRTGVQRILELDLSEDERQGLEASAAQLRSAVARVEEILATLPGAPG